MLLRGLILRGACATVLGRIKGWLLGVLAMLARYSGALRVALRASGAAAQKCGALDPPCAP